MNWLYEWVDKNPPATDRAFSGWRAGKLFLAIMIGSIIAGLPLCLFKLGLFEFQNAREERQRQQQMEKDWRELEKAAREGTAGEAIRRLFGIEAADQDEIAR